MKQKRLLKIFAIVFLLTLCPSIGAQINVNSLAAFRTAVKNSNQEIVLAAGDYNLEDLPSGFRVITFSGSNNTIDLTGVYIQVPVGCIRESYLVVSGNSNTILGGEIEDTYRSGLTEVTDFSAYNQDRTNLAYGLKGAAVMRISGENNWVDGIKLTVRGSYPYGYGSIYGIGSDNVFGLDKRCGILIKGIGNTLDNVEVQQRAFGHGIYMQGDADGTVIKNTLVEGRVRATGELYNETNSFDLPFRSDYKLPLVEGTPAIPTDEVHSLSEDGFRMYNIPGSITIENCTAKKMRGGMRLYLGGDTSVTNSTAIDCGATNWNLPSGGTVTNSSGNFAYAPLTDFRLGRSNTDIEWTIIPSPHATGPHNVADILGNNHNIVLHRAPGPIDTTDRAIVVTGDNSTIINETEYDIVLESTTSGNTIHSCGGGTITDNGTNNTIIEYVDCEGLDPNNLCPSTAELMEAECYDSMSGVQTANCSEGGSNIGYINDGEWVKFVDIDLTGIQSINARTASIYDGGYIEVYVGRTLIATIPVTNRGGWQTWGTDSVDLDTILSGIHDIYFIFRGTRTGSLFNVNWFGFSTESLSVDSNELVDNISVYPNPASDVLNIKTTHTIESISLYDILGKTVLQETTDNQIDVSSFQSGIYMVKIETDKGTHIRKIVVE